MSQHSRFRVLSQRRAKLREDLDLERYETPSEGEIEEAEDGRGVKVHKSAVAITTVTVAPLLLNSDE